MKKARNGRANFYSLKEEILLLVKSGHTGQYIYNALSSDNKLTISYPQFQRYLSELKSDGTNSKVKHAPKKLTKQTLPKREKTDPFRQKKEPIHNPTMTDERRKELF
ncbi:TraK family protein [Photobacterium damselae]